MIKKVPIKEEGPGRVAFELASTVWAERVNLEGEFNDWDTLSKPLTRERADANWRVVVELETGRRYRFRYLVDGKEWLNDWYADDFVENPYGSDDSVVDLTEVNEPPHSSVVPTTGDDTHLSTAACLVRE
jgi:1,4-alpha-glucan branching enzyme